MLFFVYVIASVGTFAIIMALSTSSREAVLISDYKGFAIKHPVFAIMMMLFLLSLAGIPPTGGFYAKFFILKNLVSYGYIELSIFVVLMSVIGAFYYLKVIKVMFFDDCIYNINLSGMSFAGLVLVVLNGLLILLIGVYPSTILTLCSF